MNARPRQIEPTPERRRSAAFTLIELIGVLAVVSILSVLAVESVMKRIREAHRTSEVGSSKTLGNAFKSAVARGRSIPSVGNALSLMARELAVPTNQVNVNLVGQTRVVLYDPNLNLGGGTVPPYTQGVAGASEVNNLRAVIVSSLSDSLPSLSSGSDFANLWAAAPETLPSGWPTSWNGSGRDLVIERLDLRQQFCRVHLNNLDQVLLARYAIDTTNLNSTVSASTVRSGWFFVGTTLLLLNTDGSIQASEVLMEDISYVYEKGRWGRYLVSGKSKPAGTFGQLVDQFLAAGPPPPDPNQFGANQQAIVDEMYYYMWAYAQWATDGFPKGGSSSSQQVPELRFIQDSSARLSSFTGNIVKK